MRTHSFWSHLRSVVSRLVNDQRPAVGTTGDCEGSVCACLPTEFSMVVVMELPFGLRAGARRHGVRDAQGNERRRLRVGQVAVQPPSMMSTWPVM
jgi:hypothetical protein